ncbi:MAG: NUDIX hydrolase, partial [Bacteroidota bacterium]
GKIIDLTVDHIQYPSGTKTFREIVEHPGGAVVLCVFENNDILLIRQYRHPFGKEIIELPAGKLDANEDPLHCAQRELQEETGYEAGQWEKLTVMLSTPGFCDEVLHIFLARDIHQSEKGQALEEGEATIELLRVPFAEGITMIERQEIVDGKTIAGIFMAAKKLGIQ